MTKGLINSCIKKFIFIKNIKNLERSGKFEDKGKYIKYKNTNFKNTCKGSWKKLLCREVRKYFWRKTWSLLNAVINNKAVKDLIKFLNIDRNGITDPSIICNKLNNYFTNIATMLSDWITVGTITHDLYFNA